VQVAAVILHKSYRENSDEKRNIALIKLQKKLEVNKFIRPACLETRKDFNGSTLITAGWKKHQQMKIFYNYPQKLKMRVVPSEECSDSDGLDTQEKVGNDDVFCSIGDIGYKTKCQVSE